MHEIIDTLSPVNGELQFTDALDIISRSQGASAFVFEGTRYDMGNYLGYLKANIEAGLRDETINKELRVYLKDLIK